MQVYRPSRRQPAGIQLGQLPACSWENEKGEENVSGRNVTGSKENDSEAFNTNIRTYVQVQMDTERRTYRYQRLISTILEVKSLHAAQLSDSDCDCDENNSLVGPEPKH